jgi:large subunit ribosomal protein L25
MSISLKAEKREQTGSAAAKKIKRSGQLPAIIYSKKGNVNVSLSSHEFEREYYKGDTLASIIELDLDGTKLKVTAHKIELDPVSDRPIHIDFFDCKETKGILAKPKLTFVNKDKSPGLKKGGFLHIALRRTEVSCDSDNVPTEITIDAGTLHINSKVRAEDVTLPKGVSFTKKGNFLIASITGRGKSEEEESATPAAGEAASAEAKAEEKK